MEHNKELRWSDVKVMLGGKEIKGIKPTLYKDMFNFTANIKRECESIFTIDEVIIFIYPLTGNFTVVVYSPEMLVKDEVLLVRKIVEYYKPSASTWVLENVLPDGTYLQF